MIGHSKSSSLASASLQRTGGDFSKDDGDVDRVRDDKGGGGADGLSLGPGHDGGVGYGGDALKVHLAVVLLCGGSEFRDLGLVGVDHLDEGLQRGGLGGDFDGLQQLEG